MQNITPTYNGSIPAYPQVLNVDIEYTDTPILIDLLTNLFQGKINGVQTVFIDLINSDFDVELLMNDTKQRIVAKAGTMGYYPILASQLMKFETKASGAAKYKIIFINFPIALGVWGADGGSNQQIIDLSKSSNLYFHNPETKLIEFKNITSDGSVGIEVTNDIINLSVTSNNLENIGDGQALLGVTASDTQGIKTLIAGDNITIVEDQTGGIKINSIGGGSSPTLGPKFIQAFIYTWVMAGNLPNPIDPAPDSYYETSLDDLVLPSSNIENLNLNYNFFNLPNGLFTFHVSFSNLQPNIEYIFEIFRTANNERIIENSPVKISFITDADGNGALDFNLLSPYDEEPFNNYIFGVTSSQHNGPYDFGINLSFNGMTIDPVI